MSERTHVLIVDDEANVRRVLATLLAQAGYQVTRAANAEDALDLVRAQDPDVVLTDLKMPGTDGMELLSRVRAGFPEIPVVLLTAHGTIATAVEAMKRGALDFLSKPFDRDEVLAVVEKATGQAERSRREFQGAAPDHDLGLCGTSPPIEELRNRIRKVARTAATVLITGDTGTGKEVVADAIHAGSDRADRPLVKINCGALPDTLVESELFGHERGAFTGADRQRPGRFELADGGTLFLDEIGELPAPTQVKLLRVLQDGVVDRVGGTEPVRVDVRLLAATHRDLAAEVAAGRFREDLLYRLKVVELHVPRLDDRRGDIPALIELFLDHHAERLACLRPTIDAATVEDLAARSWPGNVRELQNAVERAVVLGEGPVLSASDFGLDDDHDDAEPAVAGGAVDLKAAARAAAARTERRLIEDALSETDGNVTRAAERLGLSRRGLQMKMKELGLR